MSAVATAPKGNESKYASAHYFDLIDEATKPIALRKELPIGRNGSLTTVRRQHLLAEEIETLKGEYNSRTNKFPNPFNQSNYFYIVSALTELGLNDWHDFSVLYKEIKRQMSLASTRKPSGEFTKVAIVGEDGKETGKFNKVPVLATAWERFAGKESRSDNGLDVSGKVRQNIEVLQRITGINAYGLKINQIGKDVLGGDGACIDIQRKDDSSPIQVRLNTKPKEFAVIVPTMGSLAGKRQKIALPQNDLKNRREAEYKVVTAPKKAKAVKAPKVAPTVETEVAEVADATESHAEVGELVTA